MFSKKERNINVILRTRIDPKVAAQKAEKAGLKVKRIFSLLPGIAVSGPENVVKRVERARWVQSIESDRTVHAIKGKRKGD